MNELVAFTESNGDIWWSEWTYEEIRQKLITIISWYIDNHRIEELTNIFYRVDIKESVFNQAFKGNMPAHDLATELIKRTFEKYLSRQRNKSAEIDEEELKW